MPTSTVAPSTETETSSTASNETTSPTPPTESTTQTPLTTIITTSTQSNPTMEGSQIAGVVIGVIGFIVVAALLAFFIVWRRRRMNMNKPPPPELPSAYDVGTRHKHRESDSDPNYVDPEPRHYINCGDGAQEGINNPAFDGGDDDEQDENYEIPVQKQENRPPRPPQPMQQAKLGPVDNDDDIDDSEDYVNPQPKVEDDEDYEIPETNKQQQQPGQQEVEGDPSEGDYFDMTGGRQSGTTQDNTEAAAPPPPCKPAKHSGYVNDEVDVNVHPGPSHYQNLSMPDLSRPPPASSRLLRATGTSVHAGSTPQGRGRGGPGRKPLIVNSNPQGVARQPPPLVEDKSEDEDKNSYENVPAKKQRSAKR